MSLRACIAGCLVLLPVTWGCGGSREPAASAGMGVKAGAERSRSYVYECGPDYTFTARVAGEQAWLFLPSGEDVEVRQVRAASGVRYEGGGVLFWTKGREALLEAPGAVRRDCKILPEPPVWTEAAARGVDFRGVGQEPGWFLEISRGDSVVFVGDYGAFRVVTPAPEPTTDADSGRSTYRIETEAHTMEIVLTPGSCSDVMSGEVFEATVVVTLDGQEYRGCGRALE